MLFDDTRKIIELSYWSPHIAIKFHLELKYFLHESALENSVHEMHFLLNLHMLLNDCCCIVPQMIHSILEFIQRFAWFE